MIMRWRKQSRHRRRHSVSQRSRHGTSPSAVSGRRALLVFGLVGHSALRVLAPGGPTSRPAQLRAAGFRGPDSLELELPGVADGTLSKDMLNDDTLAKVRGLDTIARRRGQSLAQMALAWTLRDRRVTSALIGASSVSQLEENLRSLEQPAFSEDELAAIDRFATDSNLNIWRERTQASSDT